MAEGNSIINLGDLAKPATVLIEKVSNAVGILYEPRRIRNKAQAEANAKKIKYLASLELIELEQRSIERMIHQETRKQENIESITAQAASELPPNAKAESLDEDWIAHFFDKCDKVSDTQMQSLWANILAGEATEPGTYSKRTIDLVASMDKKDALLFTDLCQFTWIIGEPTIIIFDHDNDIYKSKGINFSTLKHFDAIGLISFEPLSGYMRQGFGKYALMLYFGLPTLLEFENDSNNKIETGKALFTQAGMQLVKVCGAQRNQGFYEYSIEQFSKKNMTLSSLLSKK